MTFKELKNELGLTNNDFAEWFGVSPSTWNSSSARDRIQNGIIKFYEYEAKDKIVIDKLLLNEIYTTLNDLYLGVTDKDHEASLINAEILIDKVLNKINQTK